MKATTPLKSGPTGQPVPVKVTYPLREQTYRKVLGHG